MRLRWPSPSLNSKFYSTPAATGTPIGPKFGALAPAKLFTPMKSLVSIVGVTGPKAFVLRVAVKIVRNLKPSVGLVLRDEGLVSIEPEGSMSNVSVVAALSM